MPQKAPPEPPKLKSPQEPGPPKSMHHDGSFGLVCAAAILDFVSVSWACDQHLMQSMVIRGESGNPQDYSCCRNYMKFKNMKLREQFQAEAVEGGAEGKPKLFAGISIHVNGFTNPTHQVKCHAWGGACIEEILILW